MPKLSQDNGKLTPEYVRELCKLIHKDPVFSYAVEQARIAPVIPSSYDPGSSRIYLCSEIIYDATYRMLSHGWTDPDWNLRRELTEKLYHTMSPLLLSP
jgi:hypothetical protein